MNRILNSLLVLCLTFTLSACDTNDANSPEMPEIENPGENPAEAPEEPDVAPENKTLIAYYSYTNNVKRIVTELSSQIEADIVEIMPAQKNLDYAADNYALGTQLLSAIKADPGSPSSYPSIDEIEIDMTKYDTIIIACPLWWSQMAAPFQTFLFNYGPQMTDKNIEIIVSSYSTGINGVIDDAKRLIPNGKFIEPALWIRSSQTPNASSLISTWLSDIKKQ